MSDERSDEYIDITMIYVSYLFFCCVILNLFVNRGLDIFLKFICKLSSISENQYFPSIFHTDAFTAGSYIRSCVVVVTMVTNLQLVTILV